MSAADFLPWQADTARQWLDNRERFAHAWLIHGLDGIGKVHFARAAAASLLCETPAHGVACGHCAACAWVAAGNHPDLRLIRPEAVALEEGDQAGAEGQEGGDAAAAAGSPAAGSPAAGSPAAGSPAAGSPAAGSSAPAKRAPSKEIRVEQIRGLASWFNTATHRGGWRVAVLYPAHSLNVISANALLKVLEEPPPHTVFLLVAHAPDRLLPTLVSRCRRLPLPAPDPAQSLQWLQDQKVANPAEWLAAAGGAPLAALRLAQRGDSACPAWLVRLLTPLGRGQSPEVGDLADMLEKVPPVEWIDTLQRLYVDLMLAAAGAAPRYFPALAQAVAQTAARADAARLGEAARWVTRQRALAGHPLNAKLFAHAALQRVVLSCQA